MFSGKDSTALYTFFGTAFLNQFGTTLSGAGDLNGDGYADLIVGDLPQFLINSVGKARVFSGKDGSSLYNLNGKSLDDKFGWSVSGAGDVNGDGHPDLIVGARGISTLAPFQAGHPGSAHVFSGVPLPLSSDVHTLSLAEGGRQTLALSAGDENASRHYLMLGSLGTTPGFNFGHFHIPLNPDIWFWVTIFYGLVPGFDAGSYANPFGGFHGQLDAQGVATASFTLHGASLRNPALNDPALVGTTFWYAYVVRRGFLGIKMVSNAVPVTVVP